ncbi:MAG: phosphoribosylamine--glycine ligase [Bacteroidales bacterium]|nr:phosphoribosylamine--glycine ligase [Bacteroidales bacterium]
MNLQYPYNVLIIGSGAREHALAWKIKQSPRLNKLFVAPGNAGTSLIATNINIHPLDFNSIKQTIVENNIKMVVVGPEEPIVKGIADYLTQQHETRHCLIIAPLSEGAKLEGSKSWAKQFMLKYNIPTAKYHIVTKQTIQEGKEFLKTFNPPYVLKADGLAAGKGVLIIHDYYEACKELEEMLNGKFGEASNTVVIEQFLKGIECSYFILTDGEKYTILPEAKDYKRIGEGDTGLNTGGMGAISPVPFLTNELRKKINDLIVHRTVYGLLHEKINYKGFIFIGLLISNNEPYVIEYNVRLGDPETEVILPRMKTDILELFESLFNGTVHQCKLDIISNYSVCVVAASKGYPLEYEKGKIIYGLNHLSSEVFHAGTSWANDQIVTNGGRVLVVSAQSPTLKEAKQKVYDSMQKISFENMYYRSDIGFEF